MEERIETLARLSLLAALAVLSSHCKAPASVSQAEDSTVNVRVFMGVKLMTWSGNGATRVDIAETPTTGVEMRNYDNDRCLDRDVHNFGGLQVGGRFARNIDDFLQLVQAAVQATRFLPPGMPPQPIFIGVNDTKSLTHVQPCEILLQPMQADIGVRNATSGTATIVTPTPTPSPTPAAAGPGRSKATTGLTPRGTDAIPAAINDGKPAAACACSILHAIGGGYGCRIIAFDETWRPLTAIDGDGTVDPTGQHIYCSIDSVLAQDTSGAMKALCASLDYRFHSLVGGLGGCYH